MYIYMVQRSNPPRPWSWVSHSTVPFPLVVWWGCGTEPLFSLWCGEGGVVRGGDSVCMTIYIYMAWWGW